MSDIAVMTDSNCGLLPEEGRRYGISILPMPVLIDGNTYYEGVDITSEGRCLDHFVPAFARRRDGDVGPAS